MTKVAVVGAGDTLGQKCLTGYFFPGYPKAPADSYVNRMRRYMHDRGITMSGTGVKNDFATADKAVRAEDVEWTMVRIEVAE